MIAAGSPTTGSSAADIDYEVWALKFASRSSTMSAEFFRHDLMGEPDAPQDMGYYFWLIRGGGRTVLVDCGFDDERARAKNRRQDRDPVALLAQLGVRPEDVDAVVITHMHYDHVGNVELFPRAEIVIGRREFEFWSGPLGDRPLMRAVVIPEELAIMRGLHDLGRVTLVDDGHEVAPGIHLQVVGGHTPGLSIVHVPVESGQLVLASDAIHYYAQLERDWPFRLFCDIEASYETFDLLRDLQARERVAVVAGHDPLVERLFPTVFDHCFELTRGALFSAPDTMSALSASQV